MCKRKMKINFGIYNISRADKVIAGEKANFSKEQFLERCKSDFGYKLNNAVNINDVKDAKMRRLSDGRGGFTYEFIDKKANSCKVWYLYI